MSNTFPPLSRSISRSTLFGYCQRKYFFSYYTGAIQDIDVDLYYQSLLLKHLSSLQMRFGQQFHELMSSYLYTIKDKEKLPQNTIQHKVKEMKQYFQESKNRDYSTYKKGQPGLSEHYYNQNIDQAFEKGIQKFQNAFLNFLQSDLHDQIVSHFGSAQQTFIENKKADFESMKIQIETIPELLGIDIWAQPDFGVVLDSKTFLVYDRKTGRESNKESSYLSNQLKIYAYKILLKMQKFRVEDIDIRCYEVYPDTMHQYGRQIVQNDIDMIQSKIVQDIQTRKTYLVDQDPQNNKPVDFSRFKLVSNTNKCLSCRFRKVCDTLKSY